MRVGGQLHAPAALPRYPLYRRLGGPQGRSGRVRKISPPNGIRSPDRPARRDEELHDLFSSLHVIKILKEYACVFGRSWRAYGVDKNA